MAKKSILEEGFETLVELAQIFWQAGATFTVFFSFLTYKCLMFVVSLNNTPDNAHVVLKAVVDNFGYFLYLLPIVSLALTALLASITYTAYKRTNGI